MTTSPFFSGRSSLATATVVLAMGAAGTDIALTADDLLRLPLAIGHSRETLSIIKAQR